MKYARAHEDDVSAPWRRVPATAVMLEAVASAVPFQPDCLVVVTFESGFGGTDLMHQQTAPATCSILYHCYCERANYLLISLL